MQKQSLALAILGAMSVYGTVVLAGEVTIYGVADVGLNYSHVKTGVANAKDKVAMKSGQESGSRLGIRSSEDLSPDVRAGFVLETGFDLDNGRLGQNDRLFGREANLFVLTPYGELSLGRVGGIGGGDGSYGLLSNINPFGTSWGDYATNISNFMVSATRMDNTITYLTPAWDGLQFSAQYSLKAASDADDLAYTPGEEGKSNANRYMALGVSYTNGPWQLIATIDSMDYANTLPYGEDNSIVATIGGSYDFACVKTYVGMQYFDKAVMSLISGTRDIAFAEVSNVPLEGYGVTIGADMPMASGTVKVAAGWLDAEEVDHRDHSFDRYGATIGYEYHLSQRTNFYTAASYMKTTYDFGEKTDQKATEVLAGIRHFF